MSFIMRIIEIVIIVHMYNVPLETLRRRVSEIVAVDCRPGPRTILTEEEETKLADYLIQMNEMG